MHVDLTKIQVIWDWPALITIKELHNFFGLANFYRRFVLGFPHITSPLSQFTKGATKVNFSWFKSQQKAFLELKHYLCFASILRLLNLQQPFEIEIDTSDYAIGEILIQHRNHVDYSETLFDTFRSTPLMINKCIP